MNSGFIKGFKKGFGKPGHIIADLINTLLLLPVYFIGVGITSLIAKLFKKHFLDISPSKKDTYWKDLDIKKRPIEKYYRQF